MAFTLETWKDQAGKGLRQIGGWAERLKQGYAPYLLYGTLCSLSLWPLVEAARQGRALDVAMALGTVAAGVGGNLLAEQVGRWKDQADEKQVAEWVIEQAPAHPELRDSLDAVLETLEAIPQAQAGLGEADRDWFAQALGQELSQLGNLGRFEATLFGSGAIAQAGGKAVGQGGAMVDGDVRGDVVTGSKTTLFDQREQKVKQQINVAGDWTAGDLPDVSPEEGE